MSAPKGQKEIGRSAFDHFVEFHENEEFLCENVVSFLAEGAKAAHPLIVIATQPRLETFKSGLNSQQLDVDGLSESGLLLLLEARTTLDQFMVGEMPDWNLFNSVVGRVIDDASSRVGPTGRLRAYGEMVDVLWKEGKREAALCLEEFWNRLGLEHSFSLFCAYTMGNLYRECDPKHFRAICGTHHRSHAVPKHSVSRPSWLEEVLNLQYQNKTLQTAEVAWKSLEANLSHYANLISSSDDAIVSKTLDGIITSWNDGAARMFGYKADEVIGKSVTLLIPPDRKSEEDRILARIRQGERVDHFESIRAAKDGRLIDVSLTISPILGADGQIVGASKIARDITLQKKLLKHERHDAAVGILKILVDEIYTPLVEKFHRPLTSIIEDLSMVESDSVPPSVRILVDDAKSRALELQQSLSAWSDHRRETETRIVKQVEKLG